MQIGSVNSAVTGGQSPVGAIRAQEKPAPAAVRDDAGWYILWSGPGREFLAERDLRESGYRVFLPRELRWRRPRPGKRKAVEGVYARFPAYLFAQLARPHRPQSRFVRGILTMDGRPVPLAPGEIERLQAEDGTMVPHAGSVARSGFVAGQSVKVRSGPFRDFIAVLDAVSASGGRLTVQLFGRPTPLRLPLNQLEAA